jgi:beta-galactosidase
VSDRAFNTRGSSDPNNPFTIAVFKGGADCTAGRHNRPADGYCALSPIRGTPPRPGNHKVPTIGAFRFGAVVAGLIAALAWSYYPRLQSRSAHPPEFHAWSGTRPEIIRSARAVVPKRARLLLDADWRFSLGDFPGARKVGFDATSWRPIDLPHDWSIEQAIDSTAPGRDRVGFFRTGVGWYRRAFTAPGAWRGQRVILEFEGAYMNTEVWINGASLGRHPYGYTPALYDLTSHLRWNAENVIAVRVDNRPQPNTRWYSGSGIYRHVWLYILAPVHIVPDGVFVTTTDLSPIRATLHAETTVRNDSKEAQTVVVETSVQDPEGHVVAFASSGLTLPPGGEATARPRLQLAGPRAWSPESPALYGAASRLVINGRISDSTLTMFGIRTVRVSPEEGLKFNGRLLKLIGGNVHHDNGPLGAAAFDRAEERKVELLKAAGFNAVRTAHNPPSPAFLDASDRLGLLVIVDAFDGWAKPKGPYDYSVAFDEWWRRDLDAMVRQARHHPSVLMWSIGNEVSERGTPAGVRIARQLSHRIRELDPSRPVTLAMNGMGERDWRKIDGLFAGLDVAGYNYELHRHRADHARLPRRMIVATESYQSEIFANWAVVHDQPYVVGDFVWSALDYLGESGLGRAFPATQPVVNHWKPSPFPWHGTVCGDLDLTGWRKPVSHYRAILWDRGERLYAAVLVPSPSGRPWSLSPWALAPALPSWTWPGHEGEPLTVEVYSRHDAVRLYLNGQLLGEKPTTRREQFKATFEVRFAPGTLRAVGVGRGREVESFQLKSSGAAAALRLTADRAVLRADGQDLAFVTVEVVDAQGQLVPPADLPVRFALKGPATIAGTGSGDMESPESYRANPRRVYQGRAIIVIRAAPQAGIVKLTATAEGVAPAEVTLRSLPKR